jgi:histidyl-tRNA synthetase
MTPSAELLNLLCNILSKRDADEFTIKVKIHVFLVRAILNCNQLKDRKILDDIFKVCGVPADKIRGTSSAVDKLDKLFFRYSARAF